MATPAHAGNPLVCSEGGTMRTTWTFHSAGQLLFGCGAVRQLGEETARLGARRVLVVTDRNLIEAGVLDPVRAALAEVGIHSEVFEGGRPEPSLDVAYECIQKARHWGPDALVGLGGGSNMDLTKIT